MSDMTLYELTEQRLALQSKLMDLEYDTETIADTLEGSSTELQAKIVDYGFVIRNMEAFGDAMQEEEKRLAARRKSHNIKVERIKTWLLTNMVGCQISKIECPLFTISVRKNPPSVIVEDESMIPDNFLVVPDLPPPSPDKKAISAALKAGQDVPGCKLESKQSISIK